jgi:acyl-CoA synthetase (AMP-forming)/AMP-acid ligase II
MSDAQPRETFMLVRTFQRVFPEAALFVLTDDEAAVIAHCAGQLAHFKVPKGVVFIDALPKNPSGKLLKRDLRLRFEGKFGPA